MKTLFSLLALLSFFALPAYSQPDTTYYTTGGIKTTKDSANWYSLKIKIDSSHFRNEAYFINNSPKSITSFKHLGKDTMRDGLFRDYYENGQLHASGNYTANKLAGDFKSYYQTGEIKRIAEYSDGTLKQGNMFDVKGNPVPYTEFEKMPEPKYDVAEFLGRNIRYPRKARREGKQGKVNVQFVVNEQGQIIDEKVVTSVDPLLDAEALRIVSLMPDWKPGLQDDKPVKVYFSLPILFRIED